MKKLKINLITIILFSAIATKSNAQQNLFSTFNNNAFSQGDTINFEVGLNNNENNHNIETQLPSYNDTLIDPNALPPPYHYFPHLPE
jgi:hypothetical protein